MSIACDWNVGEVLDGAALVVDDADAAALLLVAGVVFPAFYSLTEPAPWQGGLLCAGLDQREHRRLVWGDAILRRDRGEVLGELCAHAAVEAVDVVVEEGERA